MKIFDFIFSTIFIFKIALSYFNDLLKVEIEIRKP